MATTPDPRLPGTPDPPDTADPPLRQDVAGPAALVHWPREADRRAELAALHIPRLLLVAPEVAPPDVGDDEDWARLPADERDTAARLEALRARHARVTLRGRDLRTARGSVRLSATEAAALAALLRANGAIVSRDEVGAAVAAHVAVSARTVDDIVSKLRRRIRPVGLDVVAARGRGHTLGPRLDWPVGEDLPLD